MFDGLLMNSTVIAVIVFVNAFFVMNEVALLTVTKARLYSMVREGVFGAKRAYNILQHPEIFLSTLQIGITLMGLLLGLIGGSSISGYVTDHIDDIPVLRHYSGVVGYSISFLLLTYLSVLMEVLPKRIAMMHSEKIACYSSLVIYFLIKLVYPLVFLITKSIKCCLYLLKLNEKKDSTSVDEIKFLVNQAFRGGALDSTGKDIITRLVNIGDMKVGAIMTPRNKIVSVDINNDVVSNIDLVNNNFFNYFPVIDGELTNLIGIIHVKSLFHFNDVSNEYIRNIASESHVLYVPEIASVTKLSELFKKYNTQIAVVIDEYGDIEGVVTFSDVINAFIGDMGTAISNNNRNIVSKEYGSYVVDGNILIEEMMEKLNLTHLPDDNLEDYRTLASFMLKQMNCIPKEGDKFVSLGWEFAVVKMDRFRIDKVRISPAVVSGGEDA